MRKEIESFIYIEALSKQIETNQEEIKIIEQNNRKLSSDIEKMKKDMINIQNKNNKMKYYIILLSIILITIFIIIYIYYK